MLARSVEKTPPFDSALLHNYIEIDGILKTEDLKTLKRIDIFKACVASERSRWQSTLADVDHRKSRLAVKESTIQAIDLNQLKDVPTILNAIQIVDNTRKRLNDIVTTHSNGRQLAGFANGHIPVRVNIQLIGRGRKHKRRFIVMHRREILSQPSVRSPITQTNPSNATSVTCYPSGYSRLSAMMSMSSLASSVLRLHSSSGTLT